jgi:RND family efflux transporter MFP subunit
MYCVLCLLILSCSSKKEEQTEENVSIVLPSEIDEVRVMRLEYVDFPLELIANGTVSARNKADLKFQTSENIVAIYVKNGDRVVKGQKLAMLDPFKLQNQLAQAKDNLSRARLELQDVLIRQGYSLNDTAAVPQDVLQLAKVKSNYEQSLNQYELADYNYTNSVLYAPFDGLVANLFTKVYNLPEAGRAFCSIIDNRNPETNFKVLESELPLIRIGDKVEIAPFAFNQSVCEGQIAEINPLVDKNGMVDVKAVINHSQNQLYDGMNVKILLRRSLGKQLVIPKEALVLRTNRKVVFTLKNNKAQWVYVQTGLENSAGYVVTEGLNAGDSVIYEGNVNLADESPVKVKNYD